MYFLQTLKMEAVWEAISLDSLIRKSIKPISKDNRESIFKNIGITRKFGSGQNMNTAHPIMYEIIAAQGQRTNRSYDSYI
jgi:hypothetical protein